MQRFRNILAVYGDNIGVEDVLDQAETLAIRNGAKLTVVDAQSHRDMTAARKAERIKRLRRVTSSLHVNDVAVEVVSGTPYEEIIRIVMQRKHDLVIASADSGGMLRGFYFDNTAKQLMRKCPCPVWVLHPGRKRSAAKVMACIDPRFDDPFDNAMDRKILELSSSLARSNDAHLHIVHAWDVTGKDRTTLCSEVREDQAQSIIQRHENEYRFRVKDLIATVDLSGLHHELHLPQKSPQRAIVDFVDSHNIELVVMGTVCRVGIAGFFVGNSAETVLEHVRCGVFTVKPDGFESPVRPNCELSYA